MMYLLLIILGLVPSIIWLLFYLRKDAHPESNWMVLKIFFWGMLATIPTALIEMGVSDALKEGMGSSPLSTILKIFVGVALTEELFKYLVVEGKALKSPELDEPLDIMLYMVISALGFAALENISFLLSFGSPFNFFGILSVTLLRFIGATFLHALCSGAFGYFIALSLFKQKNRLRLFATGATIAILLHGLYNSFIIRIEESITIKNGVMVITKLGQLSSSIILLIIILTGLAVLVSWEFKKLKKLKSVCLPNFN